MTENKIIIIGYGPSGIACAIQMVRLGLHPVVIEKSRPGGMLTNARLIENYPGFPEGITGEKLARRMIKQAKRFNINVIKDEITFVDHRNDNYILKGIIENYTCDVLVAATGTVPVTPENIPAKLFRNKRIHTDIAGLKNISGKSVGIVGAGDAAFDYSLSLAEKENNVMIFNRGDQVKALKVLKENVFINNRINYIDNIEIKSLEILPDKRLHATCNSASAIRNYFLDYLIFATGRKPADGFFQKSLEGKLDGLISSHRLYLIGDLKNGSCRQVSAAVGDGVRAAMEIFHHESNQ
ncbi:MAG TPA: NAD(P)/FAD-dependent oxidoreductase [Bacteroidales bacterium]|nr:NAD(P)/FAD-dependent oxidoreductase [Bacteroidales bacterium]HNQ83063.1 NAD(P)/FAD-dependent oxidoreductase [Bacteroidales bacterium]HOX76465.1 NAD(P)/FAD-dependent oxidoreductase [Bacteroidales bacterium]HPI85272.1 NAD(P)/FAD-dependent oxidoreductase [Bacteroidales bacterium]HPM92635.1 NAD(P)/FAD-dependent oxidoreductase [Bacteroidales bacterium]